ncbi:hypothetical protein SDC9_133903 [bioreactor metagenome]|uniref:Uncharacterized protein n=1 Tax=bioreactor metagenome TaxID=1076179 RepID=A0A645DBW2_9ZZZZ
MQSRRHRVVAGEESIAVGKLRQQPDGALAVELQPFVRRNRQTVFDQHAPAAKAVIVQRLQKSITTFAIDPVGNFQLQKSGLAATPAQQIFGPLIGPAEIVVEDAADIARQFLKTLQKIVGLHETQIGEGFTQRRQLVPVLTVQHDDATHPHRRIGPVIGDGTCHIMPGENHLRRRPRGNFGPDAVQNPERKRIGPAPVEILITDDENIATWQLRRRRDSVSHHQASADAPGMAFRAQSVDRLLRGAETDAGALAQFQQRRQRIARLQLLAGDRRQQLHLELLIDGNGALAIDLH